MVWYGGIPERWQNSPLSALQAYNQIISLLFSYYFPSCSLLFPYFSPIVPYDVPIFPLLIPIISLFFPYCSRRNMKKPHSKC